MTGKTLTREEMQGKPFSTPSYVLSVTCYCNYDKSVGNVKDKYDDTCTL